MLTALGCFVLFACWWTIGVSAWVTWHFVRKREELLGFDTLARVLEASKDNWKELWEGRMSWPSFEEWFRSRLAEEACRTAPALERWIHEPLSLGMELVGMVLRLDGDRGRAVRRALRHVLSGT